MKIEIKNRFSGELIFSVETENWKLAVEAAIKAKADLSFADLRSADLRFADLSFADLRSADLSFADLRSADLRSADLRSADLSSADLSFADLSFADLRSADLRSADLRFADLRSATFDDDFRLPTGETWKEYKEVVVPALLTAGGKALAEVATKEIWECHSWDNCPMATAFGCHGLEEVPILFRPRAEQFINFFDAKMIPLEAVLPK